MSEEDLSPQIRPTINQKKLDKWISEQRDEQVVITKSDFVKLISVLMIMVGTDTNLVGTQIAKMTGDEEQFNNDLRNSHENTIKSQDTLVDFVNGIISKG